jgi:hypothetical protein
MLPSSGSITRKNRSVKLMISRKEREVELNVTHVDLQKDRQLNTRFAQPVSRYTIVQLTANVKTGRMVTRQRAKNSKRKSDLRRI